MAKTKFEYRLFISEAVGTGLLLFFGLSVVIFNWGEGTIVEMLIPSHGLRSAITGFLFGTVGCLVTISPVGKISGAHINPAVSLAFWLRGKINKFTFLGYVISQMVGAALGCLPLLLWGHQGKSIQYAITLPGSGGVAEAFTGEVITTAFLIIDLYFFIGIKKLRKYTPFTMPFLYGFMVWAESEYSGCSTNPARSFGPAFISGNYTFFWLYVAAPFTGVFIVTGLFSIFRLNRLYKMKAARVSYHNSPTSGSLQLGLSSE